MVGTLKPPTMMLLSTDQFDGQNRSDSCASNALGLGVNSHCGADPHVGHVPLATTAAALKNRIVALACRFEQDVYATKTGVLKFKMIRLA